MSVYEPQLYLFLHEAKVRVLLRKRKKKEKRVENIDLYFVDKIDLMCGIC